jgi:hypothetical protein
MKRKPNKTTKVAPIILKEFGAASNLQTVPAIPAIIQLDRADIKKILEALLRYGLRKQELPDVAFISALDTLSAKLSARLHSDLLFLAEIKAPMEAVTPPKKKKRAARRSTARKKSKNPPQQQSEGK